MKLHVVYGNSETFQTVRDAEVLSFAQAQVDRIKGTDQELQVNVGNETIILAFRVLVLRGIISPDEIAFYVAKHPIYSNLTIDKSTFDTPYHVDSKGSILDYPFEIDKVQQELLLELLKGKMK